ncbi:non-race specific disease resistance protein 1-like protein b [Artemisia annua]|uniref:Non-race specific disease resistance protein 1-like protein b n=1 Tax=Artemisia annua TaxID=35608 RepID=A0A2U1KBB5_ARTAN|nr:non-race specific disease resistance protein 1-like protein b [Artemisia annua]
MGYRTNCCCIISSILTIITTVIVICVFYTTPSDPIFTLKDIYVSALNLSDISSTTTAANQTIFFDMKLHNKNKAMGAYYDPVQITFSYIPNIKLTFPVAEFTVPKFYQGNRRSKHVREAVTTRGIAPFNRTVKSSVFKVEVLTKVGHTSPAYRKKGTVKVVANVWVGQTGEQYPKKKGIKLFESGVSSAFGCLSMKIGLLILSTATILVII